MQICFVESFVNTVNTAQMEWQLRDNDLSFINRLQFILYFITFWGLFTYQVTLNWLIVMVLLVLFQTRHATKNYFNSNLFEGIQNDWNVSLNSTIFKFIKFFLHN